MNFMKIFNELGVNTLRTMTFESPLRPCTSPSRTWYSTVVGKDSHNTTKKKQQHQQHQQEEQQEDNKEEDNQQENQQEDLLPYHQ
jgi:hypothetical protein